MKTRLKLAAGLAFLISALLASSCSNAAKQTTQATGPALTTPNQGLSTQATSFPILPTIAVTGAPAIVSNQTGTPSFQISSGAAVEAPALSMNQTVGQASSLGIWVTGEGDVTVTPDLATLSVGVDAQASSVADAQQQASGAMAAVMASLKANGIADQDITTQNYNIYPVYNYDKSTTTLTGYHVSNTLSVKIRNINNVGKIIDGTVAAGGNYIRINNITFSLSNPATFQDQARKAAVADATAKATQLTSDAGIKLGAPIYMAEMTNTYIPLVVNFAQGAGVAVPSAATTINPGQTQVTITIQMGFNIG